MRTGRRVLAFGVFMGAASFVMPTVAANACTVGTPCDPTTSSSSTTIHTPFVADTANIVAITEAATVNSNPDPSVPDISPTATGPDVDDSIPVVAVPLALYDPVNINVPTGIGSSTGVTSGATPGSCVVQSNNPHKSSTQDLYVHAEGTLNCQSVFWPDLYMEGELTRSHWYGDEEMGSKSYDAGYNDYMNIVVNGYCGHSGSYKYHNYNYGQVEDWEGNYWVANTQKSHQVNCP